MSGFEFDPIGDVPPDKEEYEAWQRSQMQNQYLVEKKWLEYSDAVLPVGCSATQVVETKRAFYAGANSLFLILVQGVTSGDEAQPQDIEMMEGIEQELDGFSKSVKDGYA